MPFSLEERKSSEQKLAARPVRGRPGDRVQVWDSEAHDVKTTTSAAATTANPRKPPAYIAERMALYNYAKRAFASLKSQAGEQVQQPGPPAPAATTSADNDEPPADIAEYLQFCSYARGVFAAQRQAREQNAVSTATKEGEGDNNDDYVFVELPCRVQE